MDTAPTWAELVTLMVHGPDRTMQGRIRHHDGASEPVHARVWLEDEPPATFVHTAGDVVDAWRSGDRVRIADPAGQVRLISDGTTTWTFTEPGAPPLESPRGHVEYGMDGADLLVREDAARWLGDDFTRPTGPPVRTTFLGRGAWAVELAPPPHKPHPIQLVVDAETGMGLQQRNDAFGLVREWTELTVGDDLDPGLFTWTGPVVTWEEQRARRRREREAAELRAIETTIAQLGIRTLRLTVEAAVHVHEVEDDGALHASVSDVGSLLRRPRSEAAWPEVEEGGGHGQLHRWSDARWDWALRAHASLAPGALADLRAQLRSS